MKRREAVKRAALAAGAVVLPGAVMALGAERPGATVLTPDLLLSIYDPTLDATATPAFMPASAMAGYVPLPDWLVVDRVHVSEGIKGYSATEPHEMPDLRGRDFRVLLDGRMVRGAFEASARAGFVRFLAMRKQEFIDKPVPYTHRGPDGTPSGLGAVTGIAFGRVAWLIRPDALNRRDSDVDPAGG